jgi:glycosyltransferase involved in cell wall biosynthesis
VLLKLLYITEDRFPPFRADVVELFARQMPALGHRIDWLMQRGQDAATYDSPCTWLGNVVHLTPRSYGTGLVGRIANNVLGMLGDLMILPLALRGGYDVLQVRDKFFASLVARAAASLSGARFVYWMSYPFAESKLYQARNRLVPHHRLVWLKGQLIRLLLYKLILPMADHVFVQSSRMKEDVIHEGISGRKLTPVPMGIRADQVGRAEDARAPDSETPLLLHLGIILRLRQSEMLVRVLHRVRARYPRARLCYVGEGQNPTDRQAVLDEAVRLGLCDAVEVTGFMPMQSAWKYVSAADICFSPFAPIPVLASTSPTKLIEYMAMGKCIVANEHPEQRQVMDDSGAGQCVEWDEEAFASETCRLLDDPAQARELAARGPDWVREHRTYDVIAANVNDCYRQLLDRP